ncbi:molecular chaperone DnaK [Candidatus Haloredivivus sp. G17]|nr:molecular chaperone DnaK [Candidatus Haloredivivus sp. G17]
MGDGIYEVQSTEGDNDLGGDDFDEEIVEWILDKFEEENDIRLENDEALQRIREKIRLKELEKKGFKPPLPASP